MSNFGFGTMDCTRNVKNVFHFRYHCSELGHIESKDVAAAVTKACTCYDHLTPTPASTAVVSPDTMITGERFAGCGRVVGIMEGAYCVRWRLRRNTRSIS
jgi:hypothetical protein